MHKIIGKITSRKEISSLHLNDSYKTKVRLKMIPSNLTKEGKAMPIPLSMDVENDSLLNVAVQTAKTNENIKSGVSRVPEAQYKIEGKLNMRMDRTNISPQK